MKVAHLILAHNNPQQLKRLAKRLSHSDAHFFVHVDLKADLAEFIKAAEGLNITFIHNRIKVFWGGFSMVQATLNGCIEILSSTQKYDYINLLSLQDYPIKNTKHIHDYLHANAGKIFMRYESVSEEWLEAGIRLSRYYFPDTTFKGRYRLEQIVNALLPARKIPNGLTAVGRSQWFTASTDSIQYVLDYVKQHPEITKFFRYTWGSDELFFQTILYNSPHRSAMINDNLRYIDWKDGGASPRVLTMEDATRLSASSCLFARKFSPEKDSRILDYIDNITS